MDRQTRIQQQEDNIPVKIRQAIGCATRRGSGSQCLVIGAGEPFKLSAARKVLAKRFNIDGAMLNQVESYLYAALNGEERRKRLAEEGPFPKQQGGWMNGWYSN